MTRSLLLPLALFASFAACGLKKPPVAAEPAVPVAAPEPPPDLLGPRPAIGADVPFTPPKVETGTLSNGVALWVVPAPSLSLVTVRLQVKGGAALDPAGKEGRAALSDRLMSQGAGKLSAEAFSELVDRLGIQLDVGTGRTSSVITMSMRKEVVPQALDLLADMVLRPTYGKADVERERDLAVGDVQMSLDDLPTVAGRLAWAEWFGAGHPYGKPTDGTVAGLGKLGQKDLQDYHKLAWQAGGASFTVTGATTVQEISSLLDKRFGEWKGSASAPLVVPAAPSHHDAPILLVDMPGSAQTMFYLVFPGPSIADADLAPARTGTIALGGTFTSRLNALLREKRGYTYGVRAGVEALPAAGVLSIRTRIRADVTANAMKDIVDELTKIRAGITDEELGKARGAYKQDQVEAMESRAGMAGVYGMWQSLGMGPDALANDLAAMQSVTRDRVTPAMARYDLSEALVVLVGDRAKIEGPLKEAGFTRIEVRKPL